MKESSDNRKRIVTFLYILGMLGMLSIVVSIFFSRKEPPKKSNEETYKNITACWTLDKKGTKVADVKKLGEYMNVETGVLSLYYQLPKMNHDLSLVYRSKDVYTRILIGKDVIYKTTSYESRFYNRSPGNLWNVLNIDSEYSEKCVELQIRMVYDTDALTVDGIFLGDKADIIMGIFRDNIFGIVVSLLFFLIGLALIVFDWLICLCVFGLFSVCSD